MSTQITGKVIEIFPVQEINTTFKKREFVVETEEQYPQVLKLETTGKAIDLLNNIKVGMTVDVSLNIKGKAYTKDDKTSYFMSLSAWRIGVKSNVKPADKSYTPLPKQVDDEMFMNINDDLPF